MPPRSHPSSGGCVARGYSVWKETSATISLPPFVMLSHYAISLRYEYENAPTAPAVDEISGVQCCAHTHTAVERACQLK